MLKQWIALALVAAACLAGCGKRPAPLPTTYPVHGKAVYKDGKPLSGGSVQFLSQVDSSMTTVATIGSDGTYSLTAMRDGLRVKGAVPGPNRVIVIDQDRVRTIYRIPYNIEPRDNEFNLVVGQPQGTAGGRSPLIPPGKQSTTDTR